MRFDNFISAVKVIGMQSLVFIFDIFKEPVILLSPTMTSRQ